MVGALGPVSLVQGAQDGVGPLGQQGVGHGGTDGLRLRALAFGLGAQGAGAIRVADQAGQVQPVAVEDGVAGDGHLAAPLQPVVHGPLGQDAHVRYPDGAGAR